MDIYTLNSSFKAANLIEEYISFIWTDRYTDPGDFQITWWPYNTSLTKLLQQGVNISHAETNVPMVVETVERTTDESGNTVMKATGRGLIGRYFENRTSSSNAAEVTNDTGNIIAYLVRFNCIESDRDENNYLKLAATSTAPTSPNYTYQAEFKSIFDGITELAKADMVGIGIFIRNNSSTPLLFRAYKGVRRDNVVFSTALDSLTSVDYINSTKNLKNIAQVQISDKTYRYIPGNGGSTSASGLSRRVLPVDATSVDPKKYTAATYDRIIERKGKNALLQAKKTALVSGEVPIDAPYKYNQHYNMGDVVGFDGDYGTRQNVRVTEYIWSIDGAGNKKYPTFVDIDSE